MKKLIMSLALMIVIVAVVTACGKKDEAAVTKGSADSNTKEITIHAKNFDFDQKEIRVNKGDTVKLTLDNTQGNHSIKIDRYNKEIKGGNTVTFTADKTGEFTFICDLFCGQGHGEMTGKLIVQ